MKTWLILDATYLCWRAFHSTGGLSFRGRGTGVVYGFLRDIVTFQDLHNTNRIVFCFDHSRKWLKRRVDYPGYKASRDNNEYTRQEASAYRDARNQMVRLRKEILPEMGFKNIFSLKGYEADDLIASIVNTLGKKEKAIIVAADSDLYQLLGPRVVIYNPLTNKAITEASFSEQYGITPSQWVDVKAIAGGKDDIVGVKGCGKVTACKFLNGRLDPKSVAFVNIVKNNKVWRRNKPICKLPYPGTPEFKLCKDKCDPRVWKQVCERYGIKSLAQEARRGFNL